MNGKGHECVHINNMDDFWDRLNESDKRFLYLDYDGTLAPFQIDRMKALPLDGVADLLKEIYRSTDTMLAIISGRPVSEILELLGDIGVIIIGSHGFERRDPGGAIVTRGISPKHLRGLAEAGEVARMDNPGEMIEKKTASIAVHTRALSCERAGVVERGILEEWEKIASSHDLEILRFNGGIELRISGANKGAAMRDLLSEQPEGAFCVYIGDDSTDEDAFGVIKRCGMGIKVGRVDMESSAQGFLPDIKSVRDFLQGWLWVSKQG